MQPSVSSFHFRPPSRASIRPRHIHIPDARPPSRQDIRRPIHVSHESLSQFLPEDGHPDRKYQSIDDLQLNNRRIGHHEVQKTPKRSRSAEPPSLRRQRPQHANYMNPTRSFRSYLRTVNHEYYADIVDLHLRSSENNHSSLHASDEPRGRRAEPYPKQSGSRKMYSPPPKKKSMPAQHIISTSKSQRKIKGRIIGDGRRVTRRKNSSSDRRKKTASGDTEALIQQLGQGVMNELSKVVDTVSSDLKLVTEQLKNLSTSMNESMLMSSFVKDPDLSMTNSLVQGKSAVSVPVEKSAEPPKITQNSPDKTSRDTRYNDSSEHPSYSDDSHLNDSKLPNIDEDDEALAEMIRHGLKQKLLGLISQNMLLTR